MAALWNWRLQIQIIRFNLNRSDTQLFNGVFSANTTHIMSWDMVTNMFQDIGQLLDKNGVFILYGPFNRNGEFTSSSNASFHQSLKSQDKNIGIGDDVDVIGLGNENSLEKITDISMPANNRILVFIRS